MFELTPVQTRRSNVLTGTGGENTLNHLANFHTDGAPASSRSARTAVFSDTAGVGSTESARGTSTGRFYNSREARPRLQAADTVIPGVSGPDHRQRPEYEFLPAVKRAFTDEQGYVLSPEFSNGEQVLVFSPAENARLDAAVLAPGDDNQHTGTNPNKMWFPLVDGWESQAQLHFPANLTANLTGPQRATVDCLLAERTAARKEACRAAYIYDQTLRSAETLRRELRSIFAGIVIAVDNPDNNSVDKLREAVCRQLEWLDADIINKAREWTHLGLHKDNADEDLDDLLAQVENTEGYARCVETSYAVSGRKLPAVIYQEAMFSAFQDRQRRLFHRSFDVVLPNGPTAVPGVRPTVPDRHLTAGAANWQCHEREINDAIRAQRNPASTGRGRGRGGRSRGQRTRQRRTSQEQPVPARCAGAIASPARGKRPGSRQRRSAARRRSTQPAEPRPGPGPGPWRPGPRLNDQIVDVLTATGAYWTASPLTTEGPGLSQALQCKHRTATGAPIPQPGDTCAAVHPKFRSWLAGYMVQRLRQQLTEQPQLPATEATLIALEAAVAARPFKLDYWWMQPPESGEKSLGQLFESTTLGGAINRPVQLERARRDFTSAKTGKMLSLPRGEAHTPVSREMSQDELPPPAPPRLTSTAETERYVKMLQQMVELVVGPRDDVGGPGVTVMLAVCMSAKVLLWIWYARKRASIATTHVGLVPSVLTSTLQSSKKTGLSTVNVVHMGNAASENRLKTG